MDRIRDLKLRLVWPSVMAAVFPTIGLAQASIPQAPAPAASPYQQRLSPYLQLLRSDNSILDPYHSFVRPRQQVQRRLNRHTMQINQLERSTGAFPATWDAAGSSRLPTGRGGTFNSFLHYYRFDHR